MLNLSAFNKGDKIDMSERVRVQKIIQDAVDDIEFDGFDLEQQFSVVTEVAEGIFREGVLVLFPIFSPINFRGMWTFQLRF